uniref:Uncharacterized protein n=1 Tax=Cucumis sativus TaxID=3659 RepID=A0A0A0KFT2_CUCSA
MMAPTLLTYGTLQSIHSCPNLRGFLPYRSRRHIPGAGGNSTAFPCQQLGKIKPGRRASEVKNGGIVGPGGGDRRGVRAEPNPRAFIGLSNLSHPLTPLPHPYPFVKPLIVEG